MSKIDKIRVVRNYDYTISLIDSCDRELRFRDITGGDLEYLESIFRGDREDYKEVDGVKLDLVSTINLLNYLSTQNIDVSFLPKKTIFVIFSIVQEQVLCNYMSKFTWLKLCYVMQNRSFVNVSDMETVPLSKFVAMYEIHKEIVETLNSDTQ
jgi:hypothetical protein